MNAKDFKVFLEKLGYQKNVCNSYTCYNRKNEEVAIKEFHLKDLDEVVLDDNKFRQLFSYNENYQFANRPNGSERNNALRLYYYFMNNRYFDNWIARPKKKKAPTIYVPKDELDIHFIVGEHTLYNLPINGCDSDCMYVRYKHSIPDDEKVPGLALYLEQEYERLLGFTRATFEIESKRIPVILSDEGIFDCYEIDYHQTAILLRRLIDTGIQLSVDQIEDIIKTRYIDLLRIGCYIRNGYDGVKGPCLVIYYQCIEEPNYGEYFAMASQVLAHEYFHYIHDCLVNNNKIFDDDSFEAEAVKEGSAEFFANCFLLDKWYTNKDKDRCAESRYEDFWKRYFGMPIPYPNALWYYLAEIDFRPYNDINQHSINKLKEVMRISIKNMKDAYLKMINY